MKAAATAADNGGATAAAYAPPTLDTLSESQIAAIRQIPAYGTQPEPVMTAQYPASMFIDHAQYELEQQKIFRKLAVPILPSARIPAPGTVLPHRAHGASMLVTRDKAGTARVFLNACQHKGATLVEGCELQKMPRLSCPYHAWTYGLDGKLLNVPRSEVFDQLDKADFPLAELRSRESGGIIWASLDRDAEPDFSLVSPQIEADMAGLGIEKAHLYGHKRFRLKANWKLVLEPFMETYHVPRLHANSVGSLFGEITRVIDFFGPHQRKVAGKINYQPDMLQDTAQNIHKLVTFSYTIFPNVIVITSPYYTSLMIVNPVGVDETDVDYYNFTVSEPTSEKVSDLYQRSYDLVLKVFGDEDFRAAELSQDGLSSGALKMLTYGGMENTIPVYYEHLESFLR